MAAGQARTFKYGNSCVCASELISADFVFVILCRVDYTPKCLTNATIYLLQKQVTSLWGAQIKIDTVTETVTDTEVSIKVCLPACLGPSTIGSGLVCFVAEPKKVNNRKHFTLISDARKWPPRRLCRVVAKGEGAAVACRGT